MKISLIGYMGSGKSVVGMSLASKLDMDFIDLDRKIEEFSGHSISDLFKQYGEIKFRKLEHKLLLENLRSENSFVMALGGGTPAYYDNMNLMNSYSTSIYLRSNPKSLTERLKGEKSKRPLIAHLADEEIPEFIAKHLFERRNYYEKANYTIDVNLKSVEEISDEIIHLLNHQK